MKNNKNTKMIIDEGVANLIFKKRGDSLVAYVSIVEGDFYGVSNNTHLPSHKIIAPKNWGILPYVNYRCDIQLNRETGIYEVTSANPIKYNISVYSKKDKDGSRKIIAQIGKHRVYLDPTNGATENSRTLDGAIRAVNMIANNFDKIAVINEIKRLYELHFGSK